MSDPAPGGGLVPERDEWWDGEAGPKVRLSRLATERGGVFLQVHNDWTCDNPGLLIGLGSYFEVTLFSWGTSEKRRSNRCEPENSLRF